MFKIVATVCLMGGECFEMMADMQPVPREVCESFLAAQFAPAAAVVVERGLPATALGLRCVSAGNPA